MALLRALARVLAETEDVNEVMIQHCIDTVTKCVGEQLHPDTALKLKTFNSISVSLTSLQKGSKGIFLICPNQLVQKCDFEQAHL